MPNRKEDRNRTQQNPNQIINSTARKSFRLVNDDGSETDIDASQTTSMPDGQGGYIDHEETTLAFDEAGNPRLPVMGNLVKSHSGIIFAPNESNHDYCAMAWHKGVNRHIYLGQDGGILPSGAPACDACMERYQFRQFTKWAFGISVVIGTIGGLFLAGWGN